MRTILVCALLLAAIPAHAVVLDRIAAIVNDEVITQSEVYAAEQLKLQLESLPIQDSMLQERIDHHLILQQLTRQPPVQLDEEVIQAEIDSFVEAHEGKEATSRFLSSVGLTDSDLAKEIRDQITIRQFVAFRFRPFVNISLDQAEKYYEDIYVPILKSKGLEAPSFADSFDEIQSEMIQAQVQERVKTWLEELRSNANITIKE